jgi:hypothetical protein
MTHLLGISPANNNGTLLAYDIFSKKTTNEHLLK